MGDGEPQKKKGFIHFFILSAILGRTQKYFTSIGCMGAGEGNTVGGKCAVHGEKNNSGKRKVLNIDSGA